MRKLIAIISVIFFSANTFAQVTITNDQLFGGTRPIEKTNFRDFGVISNNVDQDFIVSNTNKVPLYLSLGEIPEGIRVEILDKVIQPKSVGKVKVTVLYDKIKAKGEFTKDFSIISEFETLDGKITTNINYSVKFTIK